MTKVTLSPFAIYASYCVTTGTVCYSQRNTKNFQSSIYIYIYCSKAVVRYTKILTQTK